MPTGLFGIGSIDRLHRSALSNNLLRWFEAGADAPKLDACLVRPLFLPRDDFFGDWAQLDREIKLDLAKLHDAGAVRRRAHGCQGSELGEGFRRRHESLQNLQRFP